MITIIIFGSNGMLGTYVTKYLQSFYRVIPLTRKEFDISDISNLDEFLTRLGINETTCVVNCAGLIPQRLNETHEINDNYFKINTVFPQYLSKICTKYGAALICPTTDCVYKGTKGDYIETDFHDEIHPYGISKSLGEPINATVIRTSIIGEELQNKCSFMEFLKNATGKVNGWDNHLWNGITCFQYCKIVHKIIKDNLFWKGVRHIYSEKKSKYDLACIIKDVYHLDIQIEKYTAPLSVDKSLSSIFDPLFEIPTLKQQIIEQKGAI